MNRKHSMMTGFAWSLLAAGLLCAVRVSADVAIKDTSPPTSQSAGPLNMTLKLAVGDSISFDQDMTQKIAVAGKTDEENPKGHTTFVVIDKDQAGALTLYGQCSAASSDLTGNYSYSAIYCYKTDDHGNVNIISRAVFTNGGQQTPGRRRVLGSHTAVLSSHGADQFISDLAI